jgi:hypothetical protein
MPDPPFLYSADGRVGNPCRIPEPGPAVRRMNASRWMRSAWVQPPHGQFGATLAVRASETRRNNAMKNLVRNAVLGAAAIATVATTSLASTSSAHAGDDVAGALLGGFVAGALIGSIARPVYAAPVYAAPPPVVYERPVIYSQPPVYAYPSRPSVVIGIPPLVIPLR